MPVLEERSQTAAGSHDPVESIVLTEFKQSNYRPIQGIEVKHQSGALTLSGSVPSYYLKQVAIALVRRRLPDVCIEDRLEVTEIELITTKERTPTCSF